MVAYPGARPPFIYPPRPERSARSALGAIPECRACAGVCYGLWLACLEIRATLRDGTQMASAGKRGDARTLFAEELRAHRASRGWSQRDTAREAHCSESTIARIESGTLAPSASIARALDTAFRTPGWNADPPVGTFTRLHGAIGDGAFPGTFGAFAAHEREATSLFVWTNSLLPGLTQTEDYAREVLSQHPNVPAEEVASRVASRMDRARILTRAEPPAPMVYLLVDENALVRDIGGAGVMGPQLDHLIEVAALPNVALQVVPPDGAHPGLLGSCDIAESSSDPMVVNLEHFADGTVTDSSLIVVEVVTRWRYLATVAYPVGASFDMITRVRKERWK